MNKWNFVSAAIGVNGKLSFSELSREQRARVSKYTKALEVAAKSVVANPSFSDYFVKESIVDIGGDVVAAGNIEYGLCQALHGEESAIAAFRSRYVRRRSSKVILGIIAGSPGNIAAPCGNCRDILLDELGDKFEIVSGAPAGGTAVVADMKHYLFDSFSALDPSEISPKLTEEIFTTVSEGERLVNDAYSPIKVHPERRYHSLIVTKSGRYFGARDVMCDYHPIYALRDAIRQSRRANDPFIDHVVIACEVPGGVMPHVMYKDRQHLLELNLQRELLSGNAWNPPVYLAAYCRKKVVRIWKTSVKEWIPLAFNPRNFSPEFIDYLKKYFNDQRR